MVNIDRCNPQIQKVFRYSNFKSSTKSETQKFKNCCFNGCVCACVHAQWVVYPAVCWLFCVAWPYIFLFWLFFSSPFHLQRVPLPSFFFFFPPSISPDAFLFWDCLPSPVTPFYISSPVVSALIYQDSFSVLFHLAVIFDQSLTCC